MSIKVYAGSSTDYTINKPCYRGQEVTNYGVINCFAVGSQYIHIENVSIEDRVRIHEMLVYSEVDAAQYYIGRQIPSGATFNGNRVFTGPIDTGNTDNYGIFDFDN